MKAAVKIAAAAAGACATLALGAGTASAFTVQSIAGGTEIHVNHGEAVTLSQVRIAGPLLNPLYPHLTSTFGPELRTGDAVQRSIDLAATRGNGGAAVQIFGPLHHPERVAFYHYE
ncbi:MULTISPECIES: hypothetical protein [unclassified Rhodococcus (in: high G+C Gram-positive bacteria)]|uniref:hypothetical protein n=1 Tax=unclassified Rhodococcus (in: high G+C Gram-positive bacteria) TaxID=192944 RepID=UPI001581F602|nr:hypothetical protein [Rhodococcus sp. W8901]QKT13517.1 hypothetical protein HUN07_24730 [Rhodococcus sp. W8901]